MNRFIVYVIAISCMISAGAIKVLPVGSPTQHPHYQLVTEILSITNQMQQDVYNFWIKYGPNENLGGFYTTVNQFGEPDIEYPKNIVGQTRQLYAASVLYITGRYPVEDQEKLVHIMHAQFEWIRDHLTAEDSEFYYSVSANGSTVLDGEHRLSYTAAAIWGLSWYAIAANSMGDPRADEALKMATDAFTSVHDRLYDFTFGGYDQSREPNSLNGGCKSTNDHLSTTEALLALTMASNDSFIRDNLSELLDIHMNIFFDDRAYQRSVFYCNWTAQDFVDIYYGMDMKTVHILQDVGEVVDYDPISKVDIDQKLYEVVYNTFFYGFDRKNGGVFNKGIDQLGPTDYRKQFWIQMESAVAFWRAYLVTSDFVYLQAAKDTLVWYRDYQQSEIGEFYWDYNLNLDYTRGPNLYEQWKAAYHNMRCLLTLLNEIEQWLI